MNTRSIFGIIGVCFCASCTFQSTNSESDKREAEGTIDSFYAYLKDKESYSESFRLFSGGFLENFDTTQILAYYHKADSACGLVKSYKVTDWRTNVVSGTSQSSEYYFVNHVTREKGSSQETIILRKMDDGKIRIFNYDVKINIDN